MASPSTANTATTPPPKQKPPFRQIRAHYDSDTITVYQAYNSTIASAAVEHQRLDASPTFSKTRMTWIKPSWAWMLYRSGYSFKDANQERILAIRMKHEHFLELLSHAVVNEPGGRRGDGGLGSEEGVGMERVGKACVQVQWDPERTPRMGKLEYRSIQIGIRGESGRRWVEEWIEGIEDVTERARELKRVVDAKGSEGEVSALCPEERMYEVPQELSALLKMDVEE